MLAATRITKPDTLISVKGGGLVQMRLPNGGGLCEKSLAAVGDEMARGAIIVDTFGNPILAKRRPIRRKPGTPILYDLEVIDVGPQYDVCFDPSAPPHFAMVLKA